MIKISFHVDAVSPTYLYLFDHHSSFMDKPEWVIGADHGDTFPYCYGEYMMNTEMGRHFHFSAEEKKLSSKIMRYFSNFARYG